MVFTILLWFFMLLVYFSSKNNKINQWGAVSIFIFSLGPFKEFLYFDLPELDVLHCGNPIHIKLDASIYSILTAILYTFAMPACMIFALYLSHFFECRQKLFKKLKYSMLLIALVPFFIYHPWQFACYQDSSRSFWYLFTVYNFLYGIIVSIIMILIITKTRSHLLRRQRNYIYLIVFPPIWFWLLSVFGVHVLNLAFLDQVWQDNIVIVGFSICCYILLTYKEGFMGLMIRPEHYSWDSDSHALPQTNQYMNHMLKNELIKMEWSLDNLSRKYEAAVPEELNILKRSVLHIQEFLEKTKMASGEIILKKELTEIGGLAATIIFDFQKSYSGQIIFTPPSKKMFLKCDKKHITEAISNLLLNAAESMRTNGIIWVTPQYLPYCNYFCLTIRDEGCGISEKNLSKLFTPYYTSKGDSLHFGLGLTYCYNVISKHKGYIDVQSELGKGSTFCIMLPLSR